MLPEQPVAVLTLDAGRQAMEDLLVSEPDIKGVFAFNQLVIQGAYQALEQAGKTDDVQLVGFDLDPVSYQMVKDGKIDALVVQDPYKMGYDGMNIVLTNLTGGEVENFVGLGTKLLTKENAAEFANDPQVTGQYAGLRRTRRRAAFGPARSRRTPAARMQYSAPAPPFMTKAPDTLQAGMREEAERVDAGSPPDCCSPAGAW